MVSLAVFIKLWLVKDRQLTIFGLINKHVCWLGLLSFTVRRYASMVCAVIVCLSVRLSQAGVLQKWLNLGSHKQCCTTSQGLVFWGQKSRRNSNGITTKGGAKQGWGRLKWRF